MGPWILALVSMAGTASAQPVDLTFAMPTNTLSPGATFWLRLDINNSGPALDSAQLFVVLDIGTGDYWFYPGWRHYPPDLDWQDRDIAVGSVEQENLPAFTWPAACGSGSAQFVSAVLDEGVLVSSVPHVPEHVPQEPGIRRLPRMSIKRERLGLHVVDDGAAVWKPLLVPYTK